MKKTKIAFLIPRLGIDNRGAEIFVYELASYLSKSFDVALWVRKSESESSLISELEGNGINIKRADCINEESPVANFFYHGALKLLLDKFRLNPTEIEMFSFSLACLPGLISGSYDVLSPNNGFWGAVVCRIVRIFKRIPFVYTSHGGIEPLIARQNPDCYFALNRKVERWFKKYYPKMRVIYCPNGVNLQRFTSDGEKLELNLERPIFLTTAALISVKRIELTTRAVAELKKGSLLVLGEGLLRKELENLGEKLLGKGRFMIKKVENSQMPKYYRSADIFTLAAQGEPGSLVILEAMASGLPVVVNDEEHLRFVVGKGGILVNTDEITAYSHGLKRASETDFGDRPRKQAEKFSWEKVGERYKNEFMKLLQ